MLKDRTPRLFGELVEFLKGALPGLESGGRTDARVQSYFEELSKSLDALVKMDRRQESLKIQLKDATQSLEREQSAAQATIARMVSYLESTYGKTSEELKKYGIAPRRPHGGRKNGAAAQ